jgi:hypothetical protein
VDPVPDPQLLRKSVAPGNEPGTSGSLALYPLKLTLTSPTNGGRSVGIVRWRTKAPDFLFCFCCLLLFRSELLYKITFVVVMCSQIFMLSPHIPYRNWN